MTSFNINGPSQKPQITEAQNMMNNGGGGNTGYFETGRKKKKKKEEDEINPSILKEEGEDRFERSEVEYEDDDDYYGTSSSNEAEMEPDEEEKQQKTAEIINSDNIKNKFLGLIGNIEKIIKPEDKTKNTALPDGDFFILSKNDIKDNFDF